jgi:spore coat polysaccharide biosynthesis protein SpsF
MGSSRLPGKVLMPLGGQPVLHRVISRVCSAGVFDVVMVATTTASQDDPIVEHCKEWNVPVVRGDEQDVLSRYALAARSAEAQLIMRITSDCPLIDPDVLFDMVSRFKASAQQMDMVSNARVRTYPRGLDAELLTAAALYAADREANAPHQREHVTPFIYENPDRFRIVDHIDSVDRSDWRLTLDTPEDYELLSRIFDTVDQPNNLRLSDLSRILSEQPDWLDLNSHITQKTN